MTSRLAYLEALGLTAWVRREEAPPATHAEPEAAPPPNRRPEPSEQPAGRGIRSEPDRRERRARVMLGPGKGSCLYLCGKEADSTTALAADLARVAVETPVWGHVEDGGEGQLLEAAIAERLFTQVVVFGDAVARLVFGGDVPDHAGPARVTVVDDLERLAGDSGARRACWSALRAAGLPSSP